MFGASSFPFSAKYKAAYNPVHRALFLIRRSFVGQSPRAFICLYWLRVRLHLEYLGPACSNYIEGDTKYLERLHKLAKWIVTGLTNLRTSSVDSKQTYSSRIFPLAYWCGSPLDPDCAGIFKIAALSPRLPYQQREHCIAALMTSMQTRLQADIFAANSATKLQKTL